jgi:hypothetical protein
VRWRLYRTFPFSRRHRRPRRCPTEDKKDDALDQLPQESPPNAHASDETDLEEQHELIDAEPVAALADVELSARERG